jgi:mRNA interferase MazF
MPGNVFLPASATGLARDSSANVSAVMTLNKDDLDQAVPAGAVPTYLMNDVDSGLRLALDL